MHSHVVEYIKFGKERYEDLTAQVLRDHFSVGGTKIVNARIVRVADLSSFKYSSCWRPTDLCADDRVITCCCCSGVYKSLHLRYRVLTCL